MDDPKTPYFFPEALRPLKNLGEREKKLDITTQDLDFLRNLFYATAQIRRAQSPPMIAKQLEWSSVGASPQKLAGAFMMSSEGLYHHAFLYSPEGGLEKFDSAGAVLVEVRARLADETRRADLLHYLPIAQRASLRFEAHATLRGQLIEGNVFDDQRATIEHHQGIDLQTMLDHLNELPSLAVLLDQLLASTLRGSFPGLDPSKTQVVLRAVGAAPGDGERWIDAMALRDALLLFYRAQAWPVGQRREFLHPQLPSDKKGNPGPWESAIKDAAQQLLSFLRASLETYWNTDVQPGLTRRQFFAMAMSDKYRTDLLFKRQEAILSPQQWQQLNDVCGTAHCATPLHIEKARLWEYQPNYVELASSLVISNGDSYLYTQSKGLHMLKDLADLQATLKSMAHAPGHEDDFYSFLSLEERARFVGFKTSQLSTAPISGPTFESMFEDIIDKQQQNLVYTLDIFRRSQGTVNLYALLDHGLDIRAMVDRRLLALDAKGRWSTHPESPSVPAQKAHLLIDQLNSIDAALSQDLARVTSLNTIIAQQLNALPGAGSLNPEAIYVSHYAGNADAEERRMPLSSQSLVSHCLARLHHEASAIPETPEFGIYGPRVRGRATKLTQLTISQLNSHVDQLLVDLSPNAIAQIPRAGLEALKPKLAHSMSVAIREEARLRGLDRSLGERDIAVINCVFAAEGTDRKQRKSLKGFTPDAFTVSLIAPGTRVLKRLANCVLSTERGGLDPSHSGRAVLWTPAHGVETFASVNQVRDELHRRLLDPIERLCLLENLLCSERRFHTAYTLGPFQLIAGDVLQRCQQSWIDHYIDLRGEILASRANPKLLLRKLFDVRQQPLAINLQRATEIARLAELRHALPGWLGAAPPHEQQQHAELLEQYRVNTASGEDYLHGVKPLRQHVQDRLNERLAPYSLIADSVEIVPRLALAGQPMSLLDFALQPASQQRIGFNVVSSAANLTEAVVRQMLSQLKVSDDYHDYVNECLTIGKPGVEQRQRTFVQQLPWELLQHAHCLKLQARLSDQGFRLIEQVFDMPDAIARAAVAGAAAQVRPLELIATPGATTVRAMGLYLIGAGREGPQVLYAPYHSQLSFSEFESEADFLEHLNKPGALQDWVLKRLPPEQQATYRNLLKSTLGEPTEITLGAAPIQGNVFEQLFNDNRTLLLQLLTSQPIAGSEVDWETVKTVFSGLVSRLMGFLPGKLAWPWVIWQSILLFRDSAQASQDHRWRDALSAFIAGVGQMAMLGKTLQSWQAKTAPATAAASAPALPPLVTVSDVDVTAPARRALRHSEVVDAALVTMTHDARTDVYTHKSRDYIPLAGKVYRVESQGGFQRIASDTHPRPFVCRNAANQWVIDTRQHITRYGQAYGRMRDRSNARHSARTSMNIEATGMRAIRRLYPDRARMIVEALDLATFYLRNCKLNLALLAPGIAPVTRIHRFIHQFFGIHIDPDQGPQEIDPVLVTKLHRIVDSILLTILDPTLYSLDSVRFVAGSHRVDPERTWAFTIDSDPERRIYLAENFFNPPLSEFDNRLTGHFDRDAHARAALLIHELSHIAETTADAAYLNAISPFSDLIELLTQGGRDLLEYQEDRQQRGYSSRTPIGRLFKTTDVTGTIWTDFGADPDTQYIKDQILKTTGGMDLSNARGIFMTNLARRVDTILDNADSVALLITSLGRQLDPTPADRRPSVP